MIPSFIIHGHYTEVRVLRAATSKTPTPVQGAPVSIAENVHITPIDPAQPDTIQRYMLDTPINMYQAYASEDAVIERGDVLYEYSTQKTFNVKDLGLWTGSHKELVLEFVRSL